MVGILDWLSVISAAGSLISFWTTVSVKINK